MCKMQLNISQLSLQSIYDIVTLQSTSNWAGISILFYLQANQGSERADELSKDAQYVSQKTKVLSFLALLPGWLSIRIS